jgi:hypothetical protein
MSSVNFHFERNNNYKNEIRLMDVFLFDLYDDSYCQIGHKTIKIFFFVFDFLLLLKN